RPGPIHWRARARRCAPRCPRCGGRPRQGRRRRKQAEPLATIVRPPHPENFNSHASDRPSGPAVRLIPPVLQKLAQSTFSLIHKVKRLIGLGPRQTGNKLIITVEKLEKRVALLENGVLEEYNVERATDRNIVGSIFKGRVRN